MKRQKSRVDYLASADEVRALAAECNAEPSMKQADRKPFAEAVRAAKTDRIYNAHTYHTKVPPAGIKKYLEHYTKPGDLVLDPFCGSGMTGVAAATSGRNAVLVDLAPAACHIAYNHVTPFDAKDVRAAWNDVVKRVRDSIGWLYATTDVDGNPAVLDYLVWSDVYACRGCGGEIVLWEVATDRSSGGVSQRFDCPKCLAQWKKTELVRTGVRPVLKRVSGRDLLVDDADLAKVAEVDTLPIVEWFPRNRMMNAPDHVTVWGDKWRKGCFPISRVDEVYTHRNLMALAKIWDEIGRVKNVRVRAVLQFLFTSIARKDSRRTAWNGSSGSSISGTLYISSITVENNILKLMDRRLPKLIRAFDDMKYDERCRTLVHNGSATALPLPDDSIDYVFTDPPFGGALQYAELNFFWEAWLGQFTEVHDEAIMGNIQNKGVAEYGKLMRASFAEIRRVLKPGRWASIVFHSTSDAVWGAIQQAALDAGFNIVKAVPFDKVQKTYNQAKKTRAAGYDVVMNVQKSPEIPRQIKVRSDIDEILEGAIRKLMSSEPNSPRSAQFLHSFAISTLLDEGIAIEKVTIPYIIDLCSRRLPNAIEM